MMTNIASAFLMIYTVVEPTSTCVKNRDGSFVEPDTFIMRGGAIMLAGIIYGVSLLYMVSKSPTNKPHPPVTG